MNLEGIKIEPCGGRPVQYRVSVSFTTDTHGTTVNEAETLVAEALKIPDGESAKLLETSQRALAESRSELAALNDEEAGVLAERKDAVLQGNPVAPIERKLTTTQGKVAMLTGR